MKRNGKQDRKRMALGILPVPVRPPKPAVSRYQAKHMAAAWTDPYRQTK